MNDTMLSQILWVLFFNPSGSGSDDETGRRARVGFLVSLLELDTYVSMYLRNIFLLDYCQLSTKGPF